jgi:hypothetical protein
MELDQPVTDDDWVNLLSEEEISKRRAQAEDTFRDLSASDVTYLRRRAKTDAMFLASLLGYDRMTIDLHGHYFAWLRGTWGDQYRDLFLPRDHYKSTANTIVDGVQMALPNEIGLTEYPYALGPNLTMLLAHENRESASRFLFEITAAYTEKLPMLALFSDLVPTPRKHRMNKYELQLPRQESPKEPTYDTIGTGGAAQGRHYDWLKFDDLIGEAARDSPTIMKGAKNWFDNAISLLKLPKEGGFDLNATPWADSDVYLHAVDIYGINKKKSFITALDDDQLEELPDGSMVAYWRGIEEDEKPIFPELISPEIINRLRKNPVIFAAQYACNPRRSGLNEFDPKTLRYYNHGANDLLYVFAGEASWKVPLWQLDRCILIDPSPGEDGGEPSGIVVTGTDEKLNIYALETIKRRFKPPELMDEMFRLWQKWQPRLISFEEVVFSNVYRYWFYERCQQLGVFPIIQPYKVGKTQKDARIRSLVSYTTAGQFFLLEGMHNLRDEMQRFPLGRDKHLLDALAQGPTVWAPGLREDDMRKQRELEKKILAQRSAVTGY